MREARNSQNLGIVEHFAKHYSIEHVRDALSGALPAYKKLVFCDSAVPAHLAAEAMLLDLLATHKGWFGYLEHVWDDFERYVRDDANRLISFSRLRKIYCDVCSR
jgi:hypothetical protein